MDKYLLQILHDVNTIIIPGLGALTVTNKTSGEIMFMSFLKHDDGNLAKYIAEKENIAENDAKNLIAKYVREIQAKLDTGDTYDMYQFGRFIKKGGEIDFESWNSYQHPQDEDTVPDTEVEADIRHPEAPQEEPASEVKAKPGKKPEPDIKEGAKPGAKAEENEIVEANDVIADLLQASQPAAAPAALDDILNKDPETAEPVRDEKSEGEPLDAVPEPKDPPVEQIRVEEVKLDVSAIKPEENVYIPKEEAKEIAAKQAREKKANPQKEISDKMNQPIVTVAPTAQKKKEKEKKSTLFWVMVIIIFLLAAGGGTTAFFYKEIFGKQLAHEQEKKNAESTDENLEEIEKQVALETEQEAAETENTAAEEQAEVKEETEKPAVEKPAKAVVSGDKSYHIIAGGFGVESNAERLAKKYQAEGKGSTVLGKFNELYLVSYEAYTTQEEANEALKSSGIKGWIFKYPK
ncbi:MAG: SPOR domain-containing protein [Bacteroidota bacterium]